MPELWLAQEPKADALLAKDPFALLMGMILDQQILLQKAFSGPQVLKERMGGKFSVKLIAGYEPEEFVKLFSTPPALHRFPAANAERVQKAAQIVMDQYGGDAAAIWESAKSGDQLVKNIAALPGFGKTKAQIFAALLGKQFGVKPRGWQAAVGEFGKKNSFISVADIVDEPSWRKTRDYKKNLKAAAKAAASEN